MKCIFTFASGSEVYSLAMTNNTVYGGCFDHKIRVWNLNTMQKSHMLIGHDGVVRCLTIRHSTLYSGGSDTKLKVCSPSMPSITSPLGTPRVCVDAHVRLASAPRGMPSSHVAPCLSHCRPLVPRGRFGTSSPTRAPPSSGTPHSCARWPSTRRGRPCTRAPMTRRSRSGRHGKRTVLFGGREMAAAGPRLAKSLWFTGPVPLQPGGCGQAVGSCWVSRYTVLLTRV